MFRGRLFAATLVAAVLTLLLAAPAGAIDFVDRPALTLTGSPTPTETVEIEADWAWLVESFPGAADCLQPVTVVVVDSAEAAWGGNVRGIASFYKVRTATVYVEHGKVAPENMIHEFAHHLDFSCGFGFGPLGAEFTAAEGFAADHLWTTGSRWSDVPAEHFAEAVVGHLGIDSVDLPVTADGFALIDRFATSGPEPARPASFAGPRLWE